MFVMFLWCFCIPARVTWRVTRYMWARMSLPPSVPSEARDHHCIPGHETSHSDHTSVFMGVLEKWNMASARWSHGLHVKTLAFPQQTCSRRCCEMRRRLVLFLWSIFLVTWAAMTVIMSRDNQDNTNLSLLTLLSPRGISQVLKLLIANWPKKLEV